MISQSRRDIMVQLIARLASIDGIEHVTDEPIQWDNIPEDKLPCILLVEGGDSISYDLTSVTDLTMEVGLRLVSDTDLDTCYDLMEKVIDDLAADTTLNDTCIHINCGPAGRPSPEMNADRSKNYKAIWDRVLRIRYRRIRE